MPGASFIERTEKFGSAFCLLPALTLLGSFRCLGNRQANPTRKRLDTFPVTFGRGQVVNQRTTRTLGEDQFTGVLIQIYLNQITEANLSSSDKVGQRVDEKPLDRAFQMACPIFEIEPFPQQSIFCISRALEDKLRSRGLHDAILHCL